MPNDRNLFNLILPQQDGVCELPWTSMQEKDINIDLLPRTLNTDHLDSDQRGEIENAASVSLEDCGLVPDISISSSAENQENCSQEVGTIKTEYSRNRENSDITKATEATSGSEERHEIDTAKGEVGRTVDPQEISSSKAEEGDVTGRFEDTNVEKSNSVGEDQEINTNVDKSNCDGERQEINTTELKDGGAEDPNEIGNGNTEGVQSIRNYEGIEDANEAESGKGEENQVIDTEEYKDGNSEDCQKAKLAEAGEPGVENSEVSQVVGPSTAEAVNNDDCKIVVTSEFEDGDGSSSQQISSTSVRESGDSCEESLQLPLFHGRNL
ncbi:putative ubiquitin-like-specific protease 2B [Iris pallida]|uniref:Ubiquitin-like-specific protease 2B n=1 Tax=Iris pallida TaxID=29817 RepID=A0AAX6FXY1_IRIPA|nr:putative ubiquitin-like-specific protease 2B [Iris pallida]